VAHAQQRLRERNRGRIVTRELPPGRLDQRPGSINRHQCMDASVAAPIMSDHDFVAAPLTHRHVATAAAAIAPSAIVSVVAVVEAAIAIFSIAVSAIAAAVGPHAKIQLSKLHCRSRRFCRGRRRTESPHSRQESGSSDNWQQVSHRCFSFCRTTAQSTRAMQTRSGSTKCRHVGERRPREPDLVPVSPSPRGAELGDRKKARAP
jgi:hypothetical protein